MRGLGTVMILLTLGASGDAGDGAPPDEAAAPSPAPAPPIQYLKVGIQFFNTGSYERAGKYLHAAHQFRDQLKEKERIVLDVYLDELEAYQNALRQAAVATEPEVVQASRVTVEPSKGAVAKPGQDGPKEAMPKGEGGDARPADRATPPLAQARAGISDRKQEARWLLYEAREQIRLGELDEAAGKVAQVRSMDLHWGFLEDTPDKGARAIEYARSHQDKSAKPTDRPASEHRMTQAKLEEADAAPAQGQIDRAEAIARAVRSWGFGFRKSEDSPDGVLTTVRTVPPR
ncbi:MAG TPA: hypothetical protein VKP69_00215 [Isosphaeraceae bacterium]|nr:hypothetical protein [Isosphaeraceae bacterium]